MIEQRNTVTGKSSCYNDIERNQENGGESHAVDRAQASATAKAPIRSRGGAARGPLRCGEYFKYARRDRRAMQPR